ncbi:hypothetical protein EZS27_013521 [termite gut metagenome]|uniref:Uncharacterized protein n=1 Tax=termite gut metagenome TaxID=433724 RepID=A0A5J4RYK4_9ZZZZ
MAKVYRLHEGQDGTGWFDSNPITKDQLKNIRTAGVEVATSIPTPFARIDLVKSAFRWVTDNGMQGNTAQHKLVSDALDVAQLFFLYPMYKGKVKIVSWNPNDRFYALSHDENSKHSSFAKTLEVFWQQDGAVYNFDKLNRIFLLLNNYNKVIGGTSPATLFFAAPDVRIATADIHITCGQDVLFDDQYASLADRDKTFVEYIFTLKKQNDFATLFPEVYSYLDEVETLLTGELRHRVANINASNINEFAPCPTMDNENDICEVLGIPLGVQEIDPKIIEEESAFVIQSTLSDLKPLILPNDKFSAQWTYTTQGTYWDINNQIPEKNIKDENNSTLPVQGGRYYWLSIGNFLEDKIIELPYTIDSSKFKTCGAKKQLLPLSSTFFKYFNAQDVDKYLKLEELAGGGIEAKLTVPVTKGNIIFKKTYHREDMVTLEVHLAILPFLRASSIDLDYTLGLQDKRYDRREDLHINCLEKGKEVNTNLPVTRRQGYGNTIKSAYYKTKRFDAISIGCNSVMGFVIPHMPDSTVNGQVSFAVDFGTTNTHIEYKKEHEAEKAIDVTSDLPMWQSLIDREAGESNINIADDDFYEREIFPYQFNNSTNYKFPFRTALIYNQLINFDKPIDVFTHTNNFFLFEKRFYSTHLQLHTKLKWGNYQEDKDKILVNSYVECLLYIALYKTLLLNGNPKTTKIIWFYPVSMDSFEQGIFVEVWEKAYKKIFKVNSAENMNAIPESIAPYLYYRGSKYAGTCLSIDIGGGSSDIAVFENAKDLPEFISSIKFGGNAIFGDGFPNDAFSGSSDNNGFVNLYKKKIESVIEKGSGKEEILDDILKRRKDSADFSSFLFSLENENDLQFNYTDRLRADRRMKLPILVFYGAIVYYSACLIKKQGSATPLKNILFSGTASKTLKIIDSQKNYPNASNLFKHIFDTVTGSTITHLKIALTDNPKEITCKGVLRAGFNNNMDDCPVVFWLGGKDDESIWGKTLNNKTDISATPLYSELNDVNKTCIENSLDHFFELLDHYVKKTNIENEFGIDNSAYQLFKNTRSSNIKNYLEQGIKAFFKSPDKHMEETLFFYPLIGILNNLSLDLSNMDTHEI